MEHIDHPTNAAHGDTTAPHAARDATVTTRPPTTTPRMATVLMMEAHTSWRACLIDDLTYTLSMIRLRKLIAVAR